MVELNTNCERIHFISLAGLTRSFRFRRTTPSPLGHRDCYNEIYTLIYSWVIIRGRTKQKLRRNKRSIPGGTRTRNLRFRRPTPSPLGHRDCYNKIYTLISSWVIVHGRTKQKDWTNKRSIPGGTRTRSFRFRRPTHYPLGHRDCYNVMYTLISSWVIVRGRTKQKVVNE